MKTMTDAMGQDIPVKYVKAYDRKNDTIVQRMLKRHEKARAVLEKVMLDDLEDIEAIKALRLSDGRQAVGLKAGNLSTSSFDGLTKVSCSVGYSIMLDDRVKQARDMMFAYVKKILKQSVSSESTELLSLLIEDAFRTSATGSLSHARILSLLKYEVKDTSWIAARQLLIDSMQTKRGKSYIRVEVAKSRNHDKELIKLDFADCFPDA